MTANKHTLNQDWLRAMTEQQLLEHKTIIDQLLVNLPKIPNTQITNPLAVTYIAEYYIRTDGFDLALEFINTIERKESGEDFYSTKIEFLLQHERTNELEDYIQELTKKQINKPQFSLLCLKYYLSLGQRQRAEYFLTKLITEHPRTRPVLEAITLATVYRLNFNQTEFENNTHWGRNFLALKNKMLELEEIEVLPIVYCLNLDRSPKRMSQCADLYGSKIELHRIPGLPGNTLPDYLLKRITINPDLPKSAVGCSLSHIAAWEKIAENDESSPPLMIVEDDGLPIMVNRATYGISQKLMMEQKLDVLFIHEAASPLEFSIQEYSPDWKPEVLPFNAGIDRFMKHQKALPPGWGGYGYILSAHGAQKLLSLLERDGLSNHIDWQTFLYSTSDWNHPLMKSKANVAMSFQRTTGRAPQHELNSGILNFPMIAHIDFSHSTR